MFIRHLEEATGRDRFDEFLRGYFDHFAFQSITTADFVAYLNEHLLADDAIVQERVPVEEWIRQPGVPASAPQPASNAFRAVETQADRWATAQSPAADLETAGWTTHEWLHFLNVLPETLTRLQLGDLDAAFHLTDSGNSEIAHQWLLIAIRNDYRPAADRLERYLLGIGRRKLIRPLYEALAATPDGRARALSIYRRARPGYHPISADSIDQILGWEGSTP